MMVEFMRFRLPQLAPQYSISCGRKGFKDLRCSLLHASALDLPIFGPADRKPCINLSLPVEEALNSTATSWRFSLSLRNPCASLIAIRLIEACNTIEAVTLIPGYVVKWIFCPV
jgi:hypothetical protein